MNRNSRIKKRRIMAAAAAKQPVSMKQFLAEVSKIAKEHNRTFHRATVELKDFGNGKTHFDFQCYIDGFSHIAQGDTPAESIRKMREYIQVNPPDMPKPADVLVDADDLPF